MKIFDLRCPKCMFITRDIMEGDKQDKCPKCGSQMERLYTVRKFKEYPSGIYENFEEADGKPVYIKDREHFWKEAKKRGLEPVGGEVVKKVKARNRKYFKR